MRFQLLFTIAVCSLVFAQPATAQNPLADLLGKGNTQQNLPRLPDDQIEGTIWEYKGKLNSKPKEGEKIPKLEGKFRTEGKAIFDINERLALPKPGDVKKVVESIRTGDDLPDLKLPSKPQVRRLGQYRKLSSGKLRLDFDDKESLNGIMIIWKKAKTADVWMGTYSEKKGSKTVRSWIVELRPIED
ncbi:MAG: hypothetical protein O2945_03855 [Planctomycetota bacterium]|nr:hypothetical protein [Planctomycetota bacterium]MDA0918191.1 hypothetical protein [Planctomycetota bacterium]